MASTCSSLSPACIKSFEGLRVREGQFAGKASLQLNASAPRGQVVSRRFQILAQKKAPKRKQIVLTADVENLGKSGELATVKRGYFRNYLYPYGKAKAATPEFLEALRLEKEQKEAYERQLREDAQKTARMLQSAIFTVRRKQGVGKAIFGQVTAQDIADIIKANTKKEVDKRTVELPEIREVGQYTAEIKVHPEVVAQIKFNVVGTK